MALASAVVLCGCRESAPVAPTEGTYGASSNPVPSAPVARARPDQSATGSWTNAELAWLETDLSPATLFHARSRKLSFFTQMPETGLGGPAYVAISTQQGPKIFKPGEHIDPARMRESWFVVWFSGATNWTNWDSPWFLTLQRRPERIRFDANGLHFTFKGEAGHAALMPLYGTYKPLPKELAAHPFYLLKEKKKRVLTWEWNLALPADPLARARFWASALRDFPVYCEDSFQLDRAHDQVVIRQNFRWHSWRDDWDTQPLKLAPVSPVLALAFQESLPVSFSQKPFDMEILTPFGPYYGVQGVDSYEITLPFLAYVNSTAGPKLGDVSNAPCFDAWQKAHADGDWERVRAQWPGLRSGFQRGARAQWASFAAPDAAPLTQCAEALGAARLAYRLGDLDTYADASQSFARALVQLCAQRRGLKYFRDWQPWQSMEPLPADATLRQLGTAGWQVGRGLPPAPVAPDLFRLWSAAGAETNAVATTLERLIPAGANTAFLAGPERRSPNPAGALTQSTPPSPAQWPRLSWPDWQTPLGQPWNFGLVQTSTNTVNQFETQPLNWNTMQYQVNPAK